MVRATCKQILKDNKGKTTGYTIVDEAYNEKNYTTNELYQLILCDAIDVDNLAYDEESTEYRFNLTKPGEDAKLKQLLNKATILGLYIKEITLQDNKRIYYIRKANDSHIIYIPKEVQIMQTDSFTNKFYRLIRELNGTVSFIGGEGLVSTNSMFIGCETEAIIDLTKLNLINIEDMSLMFTHCKLEKVIFGKAEASKLKYLQKTFCKSTIKEIQMGEIRAENVMDFKEMFNGCNSELIDISGLSGANAQYRIGKTAFWRMFGESYDNKNKSILKLKVTCPFILNIIN